MTYHAVPTREINALHEVLKLKFHQALAEHVKNIFDAQIRDTDEYVDADNIGTYLYDLRSLWAADADAGTNFTYGELFAMMEVLESLYGLFPNLPGRINTNEIPQVLLNP